MKSGRLVVSHHSPLQKFLFRFFLTIFFLLAGVGLYFWGQKTAGYDLLDADALEQRLNQKITTLQFDKAELRDQIALVARSSQVDVEAHKQVKVDLKSLQQEILELREEVSFYRGIVAPKESSAGMRIDQLDISKSNNSRLFHYNLVLTQVLKNDRSTRGTVKFYLEGLQNGKPKKLKMPRFTVKKKKYLEFKFRYFQKFDGDIRIPNGFSPRKIIVEVSPHRKKVVKGSYNWPKAISDTAKK